MAKIGFTKLGLKLNQEVKNITINEQDVEVKQYLPINDKLELISNVINLAADANNFMNPIKLKIFLALEMIEAYTNLNFTEKQKEDPAKIYDLLSSNGIIDTIFNAIPEEEVYYLQEGVFDSADAIYTYKNSVMGILEAVTADYSSMNLDASNIQQALSDPDNLSLLRDVLAKLG